MAKVDILIIGGKKSILIGHIFIGLMFKDVEKPTFLKSMHSDLVMLQHFKVKFGLIS